MFRLPRNSVLPVTSLSVTVSHLAVNDPVSALYVTLIASLCVILVAAVTALCELAKWKLRRYISRRQVSEMNGDVTD